MDSAYVTYAPDLQHFVERLGFTPKKALLSATALGGEIMLQPDNLRKVQPATSPISSSSTETHAIIVLQDHDKLHYIMKDGRFHKETADN